MNRSNFYKHRFLGGYNSSSGEGMLIFFFEKLQPLSLFAVFSLSWSSMCIKPVPSGKLT